MIFVYLYFNYYVFVAAHYRTEDYEVHFAKGHKEYIILDRVPSLEEFSLCLWMKTTDTAHVRSIVRYRVKYERDNQYFTAMGMTLHDNKILVNVGRERV